MNKKEHFIYFFLPVFDSPAVPDHKVKNITSNIKDTELNLMIQQNWLGTESAVYPISWNYQAQN